MAALTVRVVSPTETVFEGEAASVILPAWDGMVGILPGHAPFITFLGGGRMEARLPDGTSRGYFLHLGVAKVEDDRVTVLSEYAGAVPPEDFRPGEAWLDQQDIGRFADPGNPLV